jgi:hypothetical protein
MPFIENDDVIQALSPDLGHTEAKHFQFTMDAGSTPTYIVPRHGPNQFAHFRINSWSAAPVSARLPGPIQTESLTMPTH